LSTSTARIAANSLTVGRQEAGDRTAATVLGTLNSYGLDGQRTVMGIGPGRQFYYYVIPQDIDYIFSAKSSSGVVSSIGQQIKPEHLQSARWVMFTDVLPTQLNPPTLQENMKAQFVETVQFNAPADVSFSGELFGTFDQFLAKLGLEGSDK